MRDFVDEFNALTNKQVWEKFYSHIANVLAVNKIPLDNVFFVNTPAFVVFYSEKDKAIIQKPASDYSEFITREVIFEKCIKEKPKCFFKRTAIEGDKIVSKPLSSLSYRLNWNESLFGEEFDSMRALRKFINSKRHLPVFLYVDASFFENLEKTKIVRLSTLDMSRV